MGFGALIGAEIFGAEAAIGAGVAEGIGAGFGAAEGFGAAFGGAEAFGAAEGFGAAEFGGALGASAFDEAGFLAAGAEGFGGESFGAEAVFGGGFDEAGFAGFGAEEFGGAEFSALGADNSYAAFADEGLMGSGSFGESGFTDFAGSEAFDEAALPANATSAEGSPASYEPGSEGAGENFAGDIPPAQGTQPVDPAAQPGTTPPTATAPDPASEIGGEPNYGGQDGSGQGQGQGQYAKNPSGAFNPGQLMNSIMQMAMGKSRPAGLGAASGIAGQLNSQGQQLIDQYNRGELSGPMMANLKNTLQNNLSKIRQAFRSSGTYNSSMRVQAENQARLQATASMADALQKELQQGLAALGQAGQLYAQTSAQEIQADNSYRSSLGNALGSILKLPTGGGYSQIGGGGDSQANYNNSYPDGSTYSGGGGDSYDGAEA